MALSQATICYPAGPSFSDGDLHTFSEVKCIEIPLSEKAEACLEDEIVSLGDLDLDKSEDE